MHLNRTLSEVTPFQNPNELREIRELMASSGVGKLSVAQAEDGSEVESLNFDGETEALLFVKFAGVGDSGGELYSATHFIMLSGLGTGQQG